jgi:nucleoside-triphosphatase THEP1
MEKKHKIYNLIILDESGSMESIKKTIINGFNEVVQTIKSVALQRF